MPYYTSADSDVSVATHGQLTAWRNAGVKLATGECITMDTFLSCTITLPNPVTSRFGKQGKWVKGRNTIGRTRGGYYGTHRLQTVQFCWWIMQTTAPTTEGVPASYNTHAITILESHTPKNLGIHFQQKLTSEDIFWDLLGLLPSRLSISCSEKDVIARQEIEIPFSFAQTSGDDFEKSDRAEGTTGTITKNWSHAVTGGLGAGQSALLYNTASTECDIVGFRIVLTRGKSFHANDTNYYPTVGQLNDLDYYVELDVLTTGAALRAIMATEKEEYTGDLDLTFSLTADATNDKITFAFDKMYLVPQDKVLDAADFTPEQLTITLEPLDENSSLTVTGIDSLDDDHYENP